MLKILLTLMHIYEYKYVCLDINEITTITIIRSHLKNMIATKQTNKTTKYKLYKINNKVGRYTAALQESKPTHIHTETNAQSKRAAIGQTSK